MAKFTAYIYPMLDGEETEVGVTVDYDAVYQAEYISGLPENCYPAYGEMTINSAIPDTPDWPKEIAAEIEKQKDRIEEQAWADYHSRGVDEEGPEPDPYEND